MSSTEFIDMEINGNEAKKEKNLTNIVLLDAKAGMKSGARKSDVLFFKLVLGGSVATVENVIAKLKNSEDKKDSKLLGWLMGDDYKNMKVRKEKLAMKKFLKFVFLVPMWIILTPFIYFIHASVNRLLNSKKMCSENFSISVLSKIDVPLVFAVFSGNPSMVRIFLEYGIPINVKDTKGNNVLHYIADRSGHNLEQANQCYNMLNDLVEWDQISAAELSAMAKTERNKDAQNPVEYSFQFGNLRFATGLVENTMVENILIVNNDQVSLGTETYIEDKHASKLQTFEESTPKQNNKTGWIEKRMDITAYSADHHNGFMSYLLNLLIERPTVSTSADNVISIQQNKCLQKWMSLKWFEWKGMVIFFAMFDYVVTVMIGFGMLSSIQGDMNLYPNREVFLRGHIPIFLNKWSEKPFSNQSENKLNEMFFNKYSDLQDALANGGKNMDYVELKALIQKLPGYKNFSSDDMTNLYDYVCVTGTEYHQVGDLILLDNCTTLAVDSLLNGCTQVGSRYGFYFLRENWEPEEFAIASSFKASIFIDRRSIFTNMLYLLLTRAEVFGMIFGLTAYLALYVVLDILTRTVTLIKQISSGCSMFSIFSTSLHGSNIKGQMNLLSATCQMALLFYYWSALDAFYTNSETKSDLKKEILSYDRLLVDTVNNNFLMSLVLTFLMVSRIILHLHSLRMLPWIGSFVITTFQMAFDLFQFALVYIIMLLLFSFLFHYISRDAACPIFRDAEFYMIPNAIFATFAFTFGHSNLNFNYLPVQIGYVFYILMCVILLLNLIIAIMSTTAACVAVEPWCVQLYDEGLIDEAIGMEHWYHILFPCRSVLESSYRKAGYTVKEIDGKLKIYVDVMEYKRDENQEEVTQL